MKVIFPFDASEVTTTREAAEIRGPPKPARSFLRYRSSVVHQAGSQHAPFDHRSERRHVSGIEANRALLRHASGSAAPGKARCARNRSGRLASLAALLMNFNRARRSARTHAPSPRLLLS